MFSKTAILLKVASVGVILAISMASSLAGADAPRAKSGTLVAKPIIVSQPIAALLTVIPAISAPPKAQFTQETIPKAQVIMGTRIPECHVVAGYNTVNSHVFYTDTSGKPIATVNAATGKVIWQDNASFSQEMTVTDSVNHTTVMKQK